MTYYVWTDDDGTIYAAHTPPDDRPFETHTIELDTGTSSPSGGDDASAGDINTSQASSDATVGAPTDGREEAAISAEEQKLLEEELARLEKKIKKGRGTPEDKRRLKEIRTKRRGVKERLNEEQQVLEHELAQLEKKIKKGRGTLEDKRRLEEIRIRRREIKDRLNIDTAGADVAPGADTATPGSTAESASGATSGSTAGAANTAPGWMPPPPPVVVPGP